MDGWVDVQMDGWMGVSSERLADRVVLALMIFQLQLEFCLMGHSCSSQLLVHAGQEGLPGRHPDGQSIRQPPAHALQSACEISVKGAGKEWAEVSLA